MRTADGTTTDFDVEANVSTQPEVINNSGAIAGSYVESNGDRLGFVRSAEGAIKRFNPPQSTETQVWDMNNDGAITGWYWKGFKGKYYVFLRTP